MNIKSIWLFAILASFSTLADSIIDLEDYLIPQDRFLSTSLAAGDRFSVLLRFDKSSSTYLESVDGSVMGALTIKPEADKFILAQRGKLPLIKSSSYPAAGFTVEVPKQIPDYNPYAVMLNKELQLVIFKSVRSVVNPNASLILTDCISLSFNTSNTEASVTTFCKGMGPVQTSWNGRPEFIINGWELNFPKFGTNS